MEKIKIWYRANFLDYPYWRVTYYEDMKRTKLLYYGEAQPLSEIFNGRPWIDYSVLKEN